MGKFVTCSRVVTSSNTIFHKQNENNFLRGLIVESKSESVQLEIKWNDLRNWNY